MGVLFANDLISYQGCLHKSRAGGAVLVPRTNRGMFLLT